MIASTMKELFKFITLSPLNGEILDFRYNNAQAVAIKFISSQVKVKTQ